MQKKIASVNSKLENFNNLNLGVRKSRAAYKANFRASPSTSY